MNSMRALLFGAFACGLLTGFSGPPEPGGESADPGRVWTMREAVRVALEDNPDVAMVARRVEEAAAHLARARSAYAPRIAVGGGYHATDRPGQAFGMILNQGAFAPGMDFNRPGTVDNLNVHARVEYTLYDGNARGAARDAARESGVAAEAMEEAVRNDIALAVVRVFLRGRQAGARIDAARAHLEALAKAVEYAEQRSQAGAMIEAEVLHLRVEEARAREELLRAENALELVKRAFVRLLGMSHQPLEFDADSWAEAIPPVSPEAASGGVVRPELESAARERAAAAAEVRRSRAGLRPHVSLFGRVDHDRGWETDGSGESWSAGITVDYTLWDRGAVRSEAAAARSRLGAAEARERRVRLAIEQEIAEARLEHEEAAARVQVTREWLELARENVRLARARFEEGAYLAYQYSEAESRLVAARFAHESARIDRVAAAAAVRRAEGHFPLENLP